MSIGFTRDGSAGIGFMQSDCKQRGNDQSGTRMAGALAVFPFQGFGTKISTSTVIPGGDASIVGNGVYLRPGFSHGYASLENNSNSSIYRSIRYRMEADNGAYAEYFATYKTYWVNGYGYSTYVDYVYTDSGDTSWPYFPGSPNYEPISDTVYDSDTLIHATQDWVDQYSNSHTYTYTVQLEDAYSYADCSAAVQAALATMTIPDYPDPDIYGGIAYNFSVIWPDTDSSTTISTGSPSIYLSAACNSILVKNDGTGDIYGGTISLSHGLPGGSIISAKTKWRLTAKPYDSYSFPPYPLYSHQYDDTFEPHSVINLFTNLEGYGHDYTFELSNIPPYGTGTYTPPFSPSGYGELGFSGTAV